MKALIKVPFESTNNTDYLFLKGEYFKEIDLFELMVEFTRNTPKYSNQGNSIEYLLRILLDKFLTEKGIMFKE